MDVLYGTLFALTGQRRRRFPETVGNNRFGDQHVFGIIIFVVGCRIGIISNARSVVL